MVSIQKKVLHNIQEMRQMISIMENEIKEIDAMLELKQFNYIELRKIFGDFKYEDLPGGRIKILDGWVAENIVLLEVMGHKLWVHKLITGQLAGAIAESISRGYGKAISFDDGGGGFCARHKMWDTFRGLSDHAFGCAVDFSPVLYPYGSELIPPAGMIEIFNKYGFISGSTYRPVDGMHMSFGGFI